MTETMAPPAGPETEAPSHQKEGAYRAWLEALRSGRYEQGTGQLCRAYITGVPERYCCLGVADAEVFGATFDEGGLDDLGSKSTLPPDRARVLGLDVAATREEVAFIEGQYGWTEGGHAWKTGEPVTRMDVLAVLNDSARLTFPEIADAIERFGWHEEAA